MYDPEMRKDSPMRGNLGNCSPVGGFCVDAVSDEICEAVHNAYDYGFYNALKTLKEQEAASIKCITKRTLVDDSYDEPVYSNDRFYDCPHCGQRLSRTYPNKDIKYCWKCGQAVKWE